MSAEEGLAKKMRSIQDKLKESVKTISSLLKNYQNFFTKESDKFISKIRNKCDKRMSYLPKIKDENKSDFFKDTNTILDNLLQENQTLVSNFTSSLKALKEFFLTDPNISVNESEEKDKDSNKKKLIINSTDDCGKAKNLLNSKNGANLEILEINRITMDDFTFLFGDNLKKKEEEDEGNNNNVNEEENINIKKLKFKNSILLNIDFCDYFPNIENLSITDCKIGYDVCSKINFNNIIRLSLEGIELVNENFEDLIIYLLKDQSEANEGNYIGRNLKSLSVKNNRISRILFPIECSGKKDISNDFINLTYLNLSDNNLFNYYIDPKKKPLFQKLKLLDLTNNNITSPLIVKNLIKEKGDKCLILASKNIGVIKNNKMRNFYCNYLIEKLKTKTEDYNIKTLVLEGIFGQGNKQLLININLNMFSHSLVELNLSFNTINDDEIMEILENNKNLENLKRLNLSSNAISEQFFAKFVENKYYENYKNLKVLNLSCNPIAFNEAELYKKFISNCQSLESLILKNTFISEDMNHYMKNKIIIFTAMKNGQKVPDLDKKGKEMESLIDKDKFIKNNSKVYITISYTMKAKYMKFVNKFFPYLLERIKLEEE